MRRLREFLLDSIGWTLADMLTELVALAAAAWGLVVLAVAGVVWLWVLCWSCGSRRAAPPPGGDPLA